MRCTNCQITVDESAERCPTCLRQSTLVRDAAPRSSEAMPAPPGRVFDAILLLVMLSLIRVGAYIRTPLTDWLTVGDASALFVLAAGVWWSVAEVQRSGDQVLTVKATSFARLTIGGLFIGSFAIVAMIGTGFAFADPLAISGGTGSAPRLHQWTWGCLGFAFAIGFGWLSSLFWRKMYRLRASR